MSEDFCRSCHTSSHYCQSFQRRKPKINESGIRLRKRLTVYSHFCYTCPRSTVKSLSVISTSKTGQRLVYVECCIRNYIKKINRRQDITTSLANCFRKKVQLRKQKYMDNFCTYLDIWIASLPYFLTQAIYLWIWFQSNKCGAVLSCSESRVHLPYMDLEQLDCIQESPYKKCAPTPPSSVVAYRLSGIYLSQYSEWIVELQSGTFIRPPALWNFINLPAQQLTGWCFQCNVPLS